MRPFPHTGWAVTRFGPGVTRGDDDRGGQTEAYAAEYARRAGVEGPLSQAVRRAGLRRSRYVGLARTHLGHRLTATAINFVRIGEWLAGTPRAKTRRPPFAAILAPAAAA